MKPIGVDFLAPTWKSTELVMLKASTISPAELEALDRFYREGGLHAMASPHVHYDEPTCPHQGCGHRMEWIDFKRELTKNERTRR